FVHESRGHAKAEEGRDAQHSDALSFADVFLRTSWKDRSLFSVSQAGLVNNLNDGMAWGLFPLFFASNGLSLQRVSILGALYPAAWGLTQLGTGALSDHIGRKPLIAAGMGVQGSASFALPL